VHFFTVVTITTQPRDVTVPSGRTVVFTCVVNLRRKTVTINNARWMNNMGNTITLGSTDPYIVDPYPLILNFSLLHKITDKNSASSITPVAMANSIMSAEAEKPYALASY